MEDQQQSGYDLSMEMHFVLLVQTQKDVKCLVS